MPEQPKIQFTPAQAAAISARGGSLLVSAAAGSGKTRVLVERVVGLITDPVHPVDANQLLIMTFTNAAAAKLRADITTRLAQEVRAHPGDLHLRSQQLLLQRASIGTVDAFCLHFVQQHFAMLDVPPDFETADEADLARIEQETLAATLETAYQDPDFRAFADLYDRGRTDNTAGDAILDLYHFTRALPHPAASLAAFAAMWQQDAPPKDTLWGKELLGIALARAQGAKTLLESGAAIAARDEAADRAYTAVMQDDAARVKNLCYYLKEGDWDKSLAALDAVLTGWRRAGSVKGGKDANQCASAASQLRDRAKDQMTSLQKDVLLCTAEEFAADRRRAVVQPAADFQRKPDDERRAHRRAEQRFKRLQTARQQRGMEQQVGAGVAAETELRKNAKLGALLVRLTQQREDFLRVGLRIGQMDARHGGHRTDHAGNMSHKQNSLRKKS